MAKGSVRKKGKKWYYRFYVEDASGNRVQKEFPGTESKSETESLLRKAMEDYETKMFLAQAKNITLGDMLDMWVEEELKPGSLSDGTVTAYINEVRLNHARELLLRTDEKITKIALKAGFNDISYFNRAFAAAVGMTPREYRSQGSGRGGPEGTPTELSTEERAV